MRGLAKHCRVKEGRLGLTLGYTSGSDATVCMEPIGRIRRNFRLGNLTSSRDLVVSTGK